MPLLSNATTKLRRFYATLLLRYQTNKQSPVAVSVVPSRLLEGLCEAWLQFTGHYDRCQFQKWCQTEWSIA